LITRVRLTSSLRFENQAQIGNHILDLTPAVKTLGAHQPVGQVGAQEGFFEQDGIVRLCDTSPLPDCLTIYARVYSGGWYR
jgi:hypothetical protein